MAVTRTHYVLFGTALLLLLLGLAHQHNQVRDSIHNAWNRPSSSEPVPDISEPSFSNTIPPPIPVPAKQQSSPEKKPIVEETTTSPPSKEVASTSNEKLPSFYEIALKYGTDKVTDHQYWFMYDKHFPAIRHQKLKMLEIGLGCDMSYGPGKSYYTWLEYFPNVELYYMEYDAECAAKWSSKTTGATIYAGDQADPVFLQKFIAETGGNFDIIIDDGGHTMHQQQTSLEALWSIVKPGGLYFIEDLQTSFWPSYGGDGTGGKDPKVPTMAKFIHELVDDKLTPDGTRHAMSMEMRSIECQREVCLFTKKEAGTL
ncbi:hypothetical protein PFICI_09875 [Pestalotiopsis fici W106-1]|uniref:Methyltransferase domain-containing protein n=1 Tax=Pestalotiopsis fici (strain W106-1 / CGMCC3.15140) TaxID=1229662 RepID=W3WVB7_PESFW|nr:uncharacterized protein PFICI_09875 [Pestalotiopsis fici W106-1]ETS77813.1 hypothetical protein PFICI_09875 [Pestalotiopsis fici W106-1]